MPGPHALLRSSRAQVWSIPYVKRSDYSTLQSLQSELVVHPSRDVCLTGHWENWVCVVYTWTTIAIQASQLLSERLPPRIHCGWSTNLQTFIKGPTTTIAGWRKASSFGFVSSSSWQDTTSMLCGAFAWSQLPSTVLQSWFIEGLLHNVNGLGVNPLVKWRDFHVHHAPRMIEFRIYSSTRTNPCNSIPTTQRSRVP